PTPRLPIEDRRAFAKLHQRIKLLRNLQAFTPNVIDQKVMARRQRESAHARVSARLGHCQRGVAALKPSTRGREVLTWRNRAIARRGRELQSIARKVLAEMAGVLLLEDDAIAWPGPLLMDARPISRPAGVPRFLKRLLIESTRPQRLTRLPLVLRVFVAFLT